MARFATRMDPRIFDRSIICGQLRPIEIKRGEPGRLTDAHTFPRLNGEWWVALCFRLMWTMLAATVTDAEEIAGEEMFGKFKIHAFIVFIVLRLI